MKIESLYRYPVKGLSPEPLETVTLSVGETFPGDRHFAIENGSRKFDPVNPQYLPKTHFVMLQRYEELAKIDTRYHPESQTLSIFRDGKQVTSGCLATPVGRGIIEQFLAAFMTDRLNGHPSIVSCPQQPFTDVPAKWISLVNLASVRDLSRVVGQALDPLRFRANIYFDAPQPWIERDWQDKGINCGEVALACVHATTRCAATNVNPRTAERDLNIPKSLQQAFGHADLGVYAKVTSAGTIRQGDELRLVD